jgi:hypothetical protein
MVIFSYLHIDTFYSEIFKSRALYSNIFKIHFIDGTLSKILVLF